jgi:hypothetical protein
MAACDMIDELIKGDKDEDGTFTLNGIPSQYNGKYALLMGESDNNEMLVGCQSINISTQTFTLAPISGGSVSIPMWLESGSGDSPTVTRYSGNQTIKVLVVIANTATFSDDSNNDDIAERRYFSSVAFSNGGAAKAWSAGADYEISTGAEGGSFILSDIPAEYNGKWAYLSGWGFSSSDELLNLVGVKSITANVMALAPVSNGSVSIPVWLIGGSGMFPTITGYTGNDTVEVTVAITNTATFTADNNYDPLTARRFSSVTFSNGSAAMAWSQGEEIDVTGSSPGSEGPSDPLNGTWADSDGNVVKLNNGTFEAADNNGTSIVKGYCSVSGSNITFYISQWWGPALSRDLESRWYTKAELIEEGFSDSDFSFTGSYSGNTLTITQDGESYTYTKR